MLKTVVDGRGGDGLRRECYDAGYWTYYSTVGEEGTCNEQLQKLVASVGTLEATRTKAPKFRLVAKYYYTQYVCWRIMGKATVSLMIKLAGLDRGVVGGQWGRLPAGPVRGSACRQRAAAGSLWRG